jgi:hypothetical protein
MKDSIIRTGITEAVTHAAGVPFEYGVMDCCKFAASVVQAQTGTNPMENFPYASEEEAREIVRRHGTMLGLVTAVLGEPSDTFGEGDVVLVNIPRIGDTVGVMGREGVLLKTQSGVIKVKPHRLIAGWRICR